MGCFLLAREKLPGYNALEVIDMIYDTLDHIHRYEGMHPGVLRGLRFLAQTDFSTLPDGRVEIDGENIFANVMTCVTKERNDTPEAHRKYIDIQYLIEGSEIVAVGPLERMEEEVEARPQGDIWFYRGPLSGVEIGQGRFVVVFPEDAHAPSIAVDKPAPTRKCVVKVLADWNART